MTHLINRFRPFLIAICFTLGLSLPFLYNLHQAAAQKTNPKEMTRDLDRKDATLEEEEAKLLASMDQQHADERAQLKMKKNTPAEKPAASEEKIDLKKVADAIAHADDDLIATTPKRAVPAADASLQREKEVKKISSSIPPSKNTEVKQALAPLPQNKMDLAEKKELKILAAKDAEIEGQVETMGNLFTQWQKDFESKHGELTVAQKRSREELQARIESLEKRVGRSQMESNEEVAALRTSLEKELREAQTFDEREKQFNETLAKHEAALGAKMEAFGKEYAEASALVKEQQATVKALKLSEGQLKHRIAASELGVTDAIKEIGGVRESIHRIETNLSELSSQFVESLKYRPLTVYEAPESWSDDYDYDWNQPSPRYSNLPHNAVLNNMAIVTVTEENANLWSGPGEDDKIVTTIRRGGELAVEYMQDDWYRVILADGRRAWIPSRAVIHNNPTGKNTTLRIASAQ